MRYKCGLDIGSSKIAACLGRFRGNELTNLWYGSTDAVGIKRGQWQDIGNLTDGFSKLLRNLKSKSGIKIKTINLGFSGQNVIVRHSQAVIALAERGNKSVTKRDIQNVNYQAQILGSCLEDEILHSEPLGYTVDNENEVINPLGLYGHKLKVDLYLLCAKISYINTVIEVINRLGLRLNEITLSGLAISQAVFDLNRMKGLNILCDIGKDIIQILIFNDGRLMHYHIVASGGDDLTTSLSGQLKLPHSLAEEIKISYGRIQDNYQAQDREIIVKKGNAYSTISQNSVIKILTQSSRRIAKLIRNAIQPHLLAISSPLIPSKMTLHVSGRTACLEGFLELLEVIVGIPVKIANIGNPSLTAPLIRHQFSSGESILNYLVCLGLIAEENKLSYKKSLNKPMGGFRSTLSRIPERIKEVYQEYF
jgi:cell division protein FtsA